MNRKPLLFLFLIIVLMAVLGIVVSILLESWLVFGALVLTLAAWITQFVVLYFDNNE